MKKLLLYVLCSSVVAFGASEKVVKSVPTSLGTMSIQVTDSAKDCGFAIQSWGDQDDFNPGVIAVVADGGIAKNVAKALAAQFPIKGRSWSPIPERALPSMIDALNEKYTSMNPSQLGTSDPNSMNILKIAVMLVLADEDPNKRPKIKLFRGSNPYGEANVVPQVGSPVSVSAATSWGNYPVSIDGLPTMMWSPKVSEKVSSDDLFERAFVAAAVGDMAEKW